MSSTARTRRACNGWLSSALGSVAIWSLAVLACIVPIGPLALPSALAEPTQAVDPELVRAGLASMNRRIKEAETTLKAIRARRADLEQQNKALDAEISASEKQLEESQRALATANERLAKIAELMKRAELEITGQEGRLGRRLVGIYKAKRRTAQVDLLFNADSATDLLKRSHYLSLIAEYDESFLLRLRDILVRAQEDSKKLEQAVAERQAAIGRISQVKADFETQRAKRIELVKQESDRLKEQEKLLQKMQADAIKQEQLLARLMGDTTTPVEIASLGDPPQQPVETTSESTPVDSLPIQAAPTPTPMILASIPKPPPAEFEGGGLGSLKGKLPRPIEGELVQSFGEQRHEEFEDLMVKKGIEIFALPGAEVKAVAAGKVAFSQMLPGLGQVIILDHGKRYYSLYGRLAVAQSSVGELIEKGQTLAHVGEPDSRGRNFYFEIRQLGKAVDPKGFFSKPFKKQAKKKPSP